MKFNKQIAVILLLLSMLISAIAIAVYFYMENKKVVESRNQLVEIFIAKKDIKKGTQITNELIKQTTIARQFVLNKPLLEREIIGKFAKEAIYKNESFLKEKLTIKIEKKEIPKKEINYKFNSYNMQFNLFKNPNYSLEPNDIIKIISVYPTGMTKQSTQKFSVQNIANNIRVLGFLAGGKESEKTIIKKRIKKLVKKKQVEEVIEIKADEIILDIKEDVLISLLDDYNKGKQLWMVKSRFEEKPKKEKKKKAIKKKSTPKNYPIKWYYPKSSSNLETATISYSNNKDLKDTKKAKIISSYTKECSKKDKLLLTTSKKVYLREKPSIRARIHKKIYKNYVVAYTSLSKINPSWYLTCDGKYIRKRDVREINYNDYKKLKN